MKTLFRVAVERVVYVYAEDHSAAEMIALETKINYAVEDALAVRVDRDVHDYLHDGYPSHARPIGSTKTIREHFDEIGAFDWQRAGQIGEEPLEELLDGEHDTGPRAALED